MTPPTVVPIHEGALRAVIDLLEHERLMTVAVNRPDGWPQATTVGYVSEGLNLYFVTARDSQKLENIQANPRVAVAVRGRGGAEGAAGLSLAARAAEVTDPHEIERLNQLVIARYPEANVYAPSGHSVAVVRLTPEIVTAVGVIDGRSQARSFSIGEIDASGAPVTVQPSAVSRLF